jgi:hypothetical protein
VGSRKTHGTGASKIEENESPSTRKAENLTLFNVMNNKALKEGDK